MQTIFSTVFSMNICDHFDINFISFFSWVSYLSALIHTVACHVCEDLHNATKVSPGHNELRQYWLDVIMIDFQCGTWIKHERENCYLTSDKNNKSRAMILIQLGGISEQQCNLNFERSMINWQIMGHQVQCWKLSQVRQSEANNFGGGPGTFGWFFFNFVLMIWDSRHDDLQLFWLSFNHWSGVWSGTVMCYCKLKFKHSVPQFIILR